MRAAVMAGAVAVLLVGCGIGEAGYDQRDGPAIANRIRLASSPIVQEVSYRPGDFMDSATITIILKRGVEAGAAEAFICSVVVPALSSGEPPDSLSVDILDDASELMYTVDPAGSTISMRRASAADSCVR